MNLTASGCVCLSVGLTENPKLTLFEGQIKAENMLQLNDDVASSWEFFLLSLSVAVASRRAFIVCIGWQQRGSQVIKTPVDHKPSWMWGPFIGVNDLSAEIIQGEGRLHLSALTHAAKCPAAGLVSASAIRNAGG